MIKIKIKIKNKLTLPYTIKPLANASRPAAAEFKGAGNGLLDRELRTINLLQRLYYERKMEELREQIHALNVRLANFRFDDAITKYTENSMKLFKAKLADRYLRHQERQLYTWESLWKDFNTFIKEYPVILSTTHSLRSCAGANYLFDYVIMDEASQVDIVTGALALSCAKNAVIVGDLKQLPNVVPESTAAETNLIFENFSLDPAYRYADNSMLSSITKLYQDIPRTLLKEHYRCHPKIIGFCNQKFYSNELIVLTDEEDREQPLDIIMFTHSYPRVATMNTVYTVYIQYSLYSPICQHQF
ncbi:MAG: AAA domain-containing protein [Desulfotomaculaceae bacterium]|nr:AAA domain-containing protein [Desulfotomaculaceae bacterium]